MAGEPMGGGVAVRRTLASAVVALVAIAAAVPAGAVGRPSTTSSGSLTDYCATRVEDPSGPTDTKGATKAARATLGALRASAPTPEQARAVAGLLDLFERKGLAGFGSPKAQPLVRVIDDFTYANCGFPQVAVTATDFAFGGIPATLAAATVALQLTNASSDETHEIIVYRVAPGAGAQDPRTLLALPAKEAAKVLEFRMGARAGPGASGVSIAPLAPGTYLAACRLPIGGKQGAEPDYTRGMLATFEVRG